MEEGARSKGFYSLSHSSIPVLGFKLERITSKGLGFTFEASYTSAKAGFTISDINRKEVIKATFPQYRIMYGNNYHFGKSAKYDAYFGYCLGWHAGYMNLEVVRETNSGVGSSAVIFFRYNDYIDYMAQKLQLAESPISFRLHLGMNINLTKRIGLNAEVGSFGGGLVKIGANINLNRKE